MEENWNRMLDAEEMMIVQRGSNPTKETKLDKGLKGSLKWEQK